MWSPEKTGTGYGVPKMDRRRKSALVL
jgi:hypothetical protein